MPRKTCQFHPELGEQAVMQVKRLGDPDSKVQDMLLCFGCLRESKPYQKAEFAS